ncbi:type VI secretion system lipoprotein TssJ [Enterobacter mori]|uniref:type VI secretion system lipoprotein TssJ n=1 Tax=Enterobacter mori TaxID=539813 RepID=UPI003B83D673
MNKKYFPGTVLAAALLIGCAGETPSAITEQQAIDQVAAPFAPGGITVELQTDTDLNALNEIANSCTVLVIQAQKATTLNSVLSNPFALKSLFTAAGAQDDILKVDRYAAMPGQISTLHIDRSENTRYIAVVAGYYPFPQKQHMSLVAIPVTTVNSGWWSPDWSAHLSPLTLRMRLGSDSITQFKGAAQIPLALSGSNTADSGADRQENKEK